MALITNNISGSSRGNSTVGITGSIIVSRPGTGESFPQLHGSNTLLQVSGTRNSSGTETPNVLFSGDTFVSGGFGVSDYIQLKTVDNLNLPPNNGSSFIYTSGSNHDLYFQQRHGADINATRLRWLEGSLSTGLLHGGVLSTSVGSTTFKISAGSGIVVTMSASLTSDPYPRVKYIEWADKNNISLPYSGSAQITYVALDEDAQVLQQTSPYTNTDYYHKIVLGRVLHQWNDITNGVISSPSVAYGINQSNEEFVRAFGPLKLTGHYFEASGSAPTLQLKKTAGKSYVTGRNYTSNPDSPNLIQPTTDVAPTTSKIFYEYINASGVPVILNNGGVGYTSIDPSQWNNQGTLAGVQSNRFTIQRVYWFPNSVNKAFFVYYGVKEYQTLEEAQVGISNESFVEGDNTAGAAIFLGWIIVKNGTTNLLSATDAKIIQAGLFRNSSGGGGAGGGSVLTNPGGASTNVQFNDAGYFGGDSQFTFDKTTHTLNVTNLSATGLTGSLTRLQDGAPYLVALSSSVMAQTGGISISTGSNGQVSASYYVFPEDVTVSIQSGRSFGRYVNGDVIPAKGKTPAELIKLATFYPLEPTVSLTENAGFTIPFNHPGVNLGLTGSYTINSLGGSVDNTKLLFQQTSTGATNPGGSWTSLSTSTNNPLKFDKTISSDGYNRWKYWVRYEVTGSYGECSASLKSYTTTTYSSPISTSLSDTSTTYYKQRYSTGFTNGYGETFNLRPNGNTETKIASTLSVNSQYVPMTFYITQFATSATSSDPDPSSSWSDITTLGISGSLSNLTTKNVLATNYHSFNQSTIKKARYRFDVSDGYVANNKIYPGNGIIEFSDVLFCGVLPGSNGITPNGDSYLPTNSDLTLIESLGNKTFSKYVATNGQIHFTANNTERNWLIAIPSEYTIDKDNSKDSAQNSVLAITDLNLSYTFTPATSNAGGYSKTYKTYYIHASAAPGWVTNTFTIKFL